LAIDEMAFLAEYVRFPVSLRKSTTCCSSAVSTFAIRPCGNARDLRGKRNH